MPGYCNSVYSDKDYSQWETCDCFFSANSWILGVCLKGQSVGSQSPPREGIPSWLRTTVLEFRGNVLPLPSVFMVWLRETTTNSNQEIQCPDRESSREPPEDEFKHRYANLLGVQWHVLLNVFKLSKCYLRIQFLPMATGWKIGVRFSVGTRILSSSQRPDRLWGPPSLLSNGHRGRFPWE
jgi:hypothetical protein